MELILVRHGEPAWSSPDGRGRNDPGLTERGHEQAKAAAARLADLDDEPALGSVDVLAVSPAVRARQTAAPIAEALALEADVHPWLWEIGNPPEWEGAPIEEIADAFSRYKGGSFEQLWDGIPGSEPIREFHGRVIGGVRDLLAELGVTRSTRTSGLWDVRDDAPDRVVAVAHLGTNSTIIAHLLGIDPEPWEWDRFHMGHAAFAVLRTVPLCGAHLWSLAALGDANHLPVDARTA
jgi:broad specificity phosphatase PhoE